MAHQPPSDVWRAVLGELQLVITRPNFNTWLKDTEGVALTGESFVVGVPSPFVAEWLEKRMSQLIQHTLSRVLQRSVAVHFQVLATRAPQRPAELSSAHASPADSVRVSSAPAASLATPTAPRQAADHPGAESGPNPRYRFDTFVVARCNRLAYAAACAVAELSPAGFNPLYIYSVSGLGKTHLLQAIAHQAKERGKQVLYVTAERFTNDFVTSLRQGALPDFQERYRSCDLLLMDDVQFLAGKEQTQEQFLHIFNELHDANRQIAMTADRPPRAIGFTVSADRLISRLQGGLIADIQAPDEEARVALLERRARQFDLPVPRDVIEALAKRVTTNFRELEGALQRVAAYARLTTVPVTAELAAGVLSDWVSPLRPAIDPQAVISAVAAYFSLPTQALLGESRAKQVVHARQIAMYLLRQHVNASLAQIGLWAGGRNANTVFHACQKIGRLRASSPETQHHLTVLSQSLSTQGPAARLA
ncbi:MAG: chromosomal replication initiator protein DnaA [Chloroflexi bacterium]|nr:chromosomal replication initiator protein DnaA [Chloroflexota bacterium]